MSVLQSQNEYNESLHDFCQELPSTLPLLSKYIELCYSNSSEFEKVLSDELVKEQKDIDYGIFVVIVGMYVLMIVCGVIENCIVLVVIVRNKLYKSPRNMLILNLAISDLILCSVTQPFNLVRFLTSHKNWSYGSFTCKFSAIFSGTNIFVSTISITVIALDRFQLIIHPTRSNLQRIATFKAMFLMWVVSVVLASPMVYFTKIESFIKPNGKDLMRRCTEYDPHYLMRQIKLAYSMMSMMIQYVAPLLIVITVYTRIYIKVKRRMINRSLHSPDPESSLSRKESFSRVVMNVHRRKQLFELRRQRRTNIILLCIGVIFALSWLPLNVMNLIMDIFLVEPSHKDSRSFKIVIWRHVKIFQAVSLIIVLCSACSNPFLYSWLNTNFKQEFRKIIFCQRKKGIGSKFLEHYETKSFMDTGVYEDMCRKEMIPNHSVRNIAVGGVEILIH